MGKNAAVGLVVLVLAAVGTGAAVSTEDDATAAKLATQVCSSCHGPGGDSTSPTFPKLAAQQQAYLAMQIRTFKSARGRNEPEAHDYMLGMAALIDDATVDALARYYAHQPPPAGKKGPPVLIERGRHLFEQGSPERGIAACASCHGKDAAGNGIFPRLAGQHAPYVVRQLKAIQQRLRDSPVMHGIVKDLTPDEIDAVAAYVQSL
jgi:cytochrome c553